MDQFYPETFKKLLLVVLRAAAILGILAAVSCTKAQAQGLVFKHPVLEINKQGQVGDVYRFSQVANNIDALVKISDRSSSKVTLKSIDIASSGWDKAFQPQVTYGNNETPNGNTDWWMEFEITFVNATTTVPVPVSKVDLTAIDIDGNGSRINEWIGLYNLKSYTVEHYTSLGISNITELLSGVSTLVGKKFAGPVTNYQDIDTSATRVMVTASYENLVTFRLRTGGHSSGSSSAADRMYSFWFRSFNYQTPVDGSLPVRLSSFTAKKADSKVVLNWTSEMEKDVSHFVVERSLNGSQYTDAGILFTDGNSSSRREYSFTDDLKNINAPIVYYRLRMVDLDKTFEWSTVRMIRMAGNNGGNATVLAYPNPVVNELHLTLPFSWQDKQVTIDVINVSGQVIKHIVQPRAGQTENVAVADLAAGLYIVKLSNGTETAIQRIVKPK